MRKLYILLPITVISLCGCKTEKVSKESYDTMYNHIVDVWNQSLEGVHFDNAFYGDSRVIGGDFVAEFSNKSVVNLGIGGDKVSNLISRFKLIETLTPSRVFLAIGGNDALSSNYNFDTFKSEYKTLLDMFKNKNIDVVVHNVVGITTVNSSVSKNTANKGNKNIAEINSYIKSVSIEMNYTFIDVASAMNKANSNEMNGDYSADGVHFNEAGYRVWFDMIASYIV